VEQLTQQLLDKELQDHLRYFQQLLQQVVVEEEKLVVDL
jgi:hypothetical protein